MTNTCLVEQGKPVNPEEGLPTEGRKYLPGGGAKTMSEDVAESEQGTAMPIRLLDRMTNGSIPDTSRQGTEGGNHLLS